MHTMLGVVEASSRRGVRVGRVVSETFSIYGRHLGALIGAAFVLFVVVGILTAILAGPARDELSWGELLLVLLAIVIRAAAAALFTGFVVKLVQDSRDGRRDFGVGELLSSAAPAIPALIVMSILFGLGVGIGLILLVIPGLFLLTIWALTAPAIVVEGAGPLESFGRSRELVRGQGWSVFWTIVVVWLLTAVITGVLGLIGDAISGAMYGVALTLAALVTAPLHALAVSLMFFDLGGGRAAAAEPPARPAPPA
jgi:hypothetical protein